MNTSSPCGITVLQAELGRSATKSWTWNAETWTSVGYDAGMRFNAIECPADNLEQLAAVLETVHRNPRRLVVRGALTAHALEQVAAERAIRRLSINRADDAATLCDVPRRWAMIDIDQLPMPGQADLINDPEAVVDYAIRAVLPPNFHDAAAWWQLSSSAGFKHDVVKAHVFFELTEAVDCAHLKAVLKQSVPGADSAVAHPGQPLYIAAPVIKGGTDPLPRRTGWLRRGAGAVVLPELVPVARFAERRSGTASGGLLDGAASEVEALALLGDGEGLEGFHGPLLAATMRYAQQCRQAGERDDDAAVERMADAIRNAPRGGRTADELKGYVASLRRYINGAFGRLGPAASDAIELPDMPALPDDLPGVEAARMELRDHVVAFMERAFAWHQGQPARTAGGCLDGSEFMDDLPAASAAEQPHAAAEPPEHAGLIVDVGVGKSHAALEGIGRFITAAKAAGLPHRVLWLVPTRKLGGEAWMKMQFEHPDLTPEFMIGREKLFEGKAMCLNPADVRAALEAGQDVERTICRTCPFRNECRYQAQKPGLAAADVVVASHAYLFSPLPEEIRKGFGLVVIDESFWKTGLDSERSVRVAGFADDVPQHPVLRGGEVDVTTTEELKWISAKAKQAFDATATGDFVSRQALDDAELTSTDCTAAIAREWARVRELIAPGQSGEERKAAVLATAGNAEARTRITVWRALRELLEGDAARTGRLQAGIGGGGAGGAPHGVIRLHTRQDIATWIAELPMLLLDATMNTAAVKHYLPQFRELASIRVATPHMRVHQVIGSGWGKSFLTGATDAAAHRLSDAAVFVRQHSGGDALVVTYQAIETEFQAPGIRTGHFNAVAGLDEYRNVRCLFVIGRPLPAPEPLRDMALALTGRAIDAGSAGEVRQNIRTVDGRVTPMTFKGYSNPDLEAVRVAITDAEVIQAIGRGRGVGRTAETPLDVFVLANVVLPLAVCDVRDWRDVAPGVEDYMADRGAVLESADDAFRFYPKMFSSVDAAKKALQRGKEASIRTFSYKDLFIRDCPDARPIRVTYQRSGAGAKRRYAHVAAGRITTFRAELERVVGPLASYAVELDEQPASDAPATVRPRVARPSRARVTPPAAFPADIGLAAELTGLMQ